MTETIEPMVAQIDQQKLAVELIEKARAEGVDLVGPGGLLTGLTKTVLETALEAEMVEHLGYDKHDPMGRKRGELSQRHPAEDGAHRGRAGGDRGPVRSGRDVRAGDCAEAATASGWYRSDRAVVDRPGFDDR
jgi:hypothetical protein